MRLIERTIDKHGNALLLPDYELEGWTTTLPQKFTMQDIIELYKDHATHEQFHSEFKTLRRPQVHNIFVLFTLHNFAFSGLVVYLWFLSHPMPWRAEGVTLYIMWGIFGMIVCTPLAGILRLLLVWLSEVGGLDRAAWVARQLKPLSIHSSAIPRVKNLVETCHESYFPQVARRI